MNINAFSFLNSSYKKRLKNPKKGKEIDSKRA